MPTNRAGAAVTSTPQVLHGIGVSAGTATGPVLIVRAAPGPDPDEPATTDPALASGQVRAAMREVAAALTDQARTAPAAAAAILEATAAMAADRGLGKAVDKELATAAASPGPSPTPSRRTRSGCGPWADTWPSGSPTCRTCATG